MEEVIGIFNKDPAILKAKGRAAASFISEKYCPEIEEMEVVTAWKKNSCISWYGY